MKWFLKYQDTVIATWNRFIGYRKSGEAIKDTYNYRKKQISGKLLCMPYSRRLNSCKEVVWQRDWITFLKIRIIDL